MHSTGQCSKFCSRFPNGWKNSKSLSRQRLASINWIDSWSRQVACCLGRATGASKQVNKI